MLKERVKPLVGELLKIIQRDDLYRFGLEAVLLANFVAEKPGGKAVDLGSGDGVIPLLLAFKKGFRVLGLELQKELVELSRKSVKLNQMEDIIDIEQLDICHVPEKFKRGGYDVVTANPPFFQMGKGKVSPFASVAIARHEICCSLEDIFKAAAHLLNKNGLFYIVHRPRRLADSFALCREYCFQPCKIRFVYPRSDVPANIFLLACSKGGSPCLEVLAPLVIYEGDDYSSAIKDIYSQ